MNTENIEQQINQGEAVPEKKPPFFTDLQEEIREFNEVFSNFNESIDYEVKLYRVTGVKRTKNFLKKFINEIPDEELIGNEYGGGKFAIMGVHPIEKKLHCKYYDIDELFTKKLEDRNKAAENLNLNSPISNPISQLKELTSIIKDMNVNQNPINLMEGMTTMFTKGLSKIQGAVIDNTIDNMKNKPEEKETDISSILEMISNFGNKFLEARGQQAELYKQVIKSDPNFQQAEEDEDLIVEIYDSCCEDPNIGKEKIDSIMDKLGLKTPGEPLTPAPNVGNLFNNDIQESVKN